MVCMESYKCSVHAYFNHVFSIIPVHKYFRSMHCLCISVAFFECTICHSTMMVEIDRGRIAEPTVCTHCNAKYTMTLVHNRSYFTDKQMVKLQESPGKDIYVFTYTCKVYLHDHCNIYH